MHRIVEKIHVGPEEKKHSGSTTLISSLTINGDFGPTNIHIEKMSKSLKFFATLM
jgi:hypothetical protein